MSAIITPFAFYLDIVCGAFGINHDCPFSSPFTDYIRLSVRLLKGKNTYGKNITFFGVFE